MQNTHFYDGKLKDITKHILDNYDYDINFADSISDIKKYAISMNYNRVNDLNRIMDLLINDPKNNYDPTNNIKVEDLLPRLWKLVNKRDNEIHLMEKDKIIIKDMSKNPSLTDIEQNILLCLSSSDKLSIEHIDAINFMSKNNKLKDNDKKFLQNLTNGCRLLFLEQIADITNGTCSQGRCTRLIQLFT